jgi:hypothetical protein
MINMTKIQNAIAESISNGTRPTISIKAPDIYAITALMDSDDAAAIQFGPRWHVDGTTDAGDSFELSIMVDVDYSEYTIYISDEASYYGSECTQDDADEISEKLCEMIERQFPGIETDLWSDGNGSSKTTGPDDNVCDEINEWISNNWTAAL